MMLEKCAEVVFFFAKQYKFFDTLYAEHPKISYIKFLALFLRDGDVMLSREVLIGRLPLRVLHP